MGTISQSQTGSLWDGWPLLLKSLSEFFQGAWGFVSLLDLINEHCPLHFNCIGSRGLCRPVHHIDPSISEECCADSGGMWSSVVMLKQRYLAENHQDSLQFHEVKMCEVCAEQGWTYQLLSLWLWYCFSVLTLVVNSLIEWSFYTCWFSLLSVNKELLNWRLFFHCKMLRSNSDWTHRNAYSSSIHNHTFLKFGTKAVKYPYYHLLKLQDNWLTMSKHILQLNFGVFNAVRCTCILNVKNLFL